MLTHIVRYIFRTARHMNFKLAHGWRTTTRISYKRHDLQGHKSRSKIKVARSRDQSEPSWPDAVPVSLEAGGGIPCRPNPAATLLVDIISYHIINIFVKRHRQRWRGKAAGEAVYQCGSLQCVRLLVESLRSSELICWQENPGIT